MDVKLTVGMATHNDWQGVYFTTQALRLYHPEVVDNCELLVVDNDPEGQEGGWTRDLVENWLAPHAGKPGQWAKVTYVPLPEVEGTAAPRDHVFRAASGQYVLCLDCHVLLWPGSIKRLLNYYDANPGTKDLLSGPIFMDDYIHYGTHFDDVWRGQMWGVWACAWQCPCGFIFCPREFARSHGTPTPPSVSFHPIMGGDHCPVCPDCGKVIQVTSEWWGHEAPLGHSGFRAVGKSIDDPPFEIPAMGLGLFSCAKDAWLGFNPRFRGFGGEEFYTHTKFRQAGARCLCLPFLRWTHRFTRQGQAIPYPLNDWHKLRNHVIGHQELGLPLDRLHAEWVGNYHFPQNQWDEAVAGAEWPSGAEHGANRYRPQQFAREIENARRAEAVKGQEQMSRLPTEGGGFPPSEAKGGRLAIVDGSVVIITGAGDVHAVR
jgi:hypothetical protein